MLKRSEWLSALAGVGLVLLYALLTRPASPAVPPGAEPEIRLRHVHPDKPPALVSRVYDVSDLVAQADAFSAYTTSLLTPEQRAYTGPAWRSPPHSSEGLLATLHACDAPDGEVAATSPVIGGRVSVLAPEAKHRQIEALLQLLRFQTAGPEEREP